MSSDSTNQPSDSTGSLMENATNIVNKTLENLTNLTVEMLTTNDPKQETTTTTTVATMTTTTATTNSRYDSTNSDNFFQELMEDGQADTMPFRSTNATSYFAYLYKTYSYLVPDYLVESFRYFFDSFSIFVSNTLDTISTFVSNYDPTRSGSATSASKVSTTKLSFETPASPLISFEIKILTSLLIVLILLGLFTLVLWNIFGSHIKEFYANPTSFTKTDSDLHLDNKNYLRINQKKRKLHD